MSNVSMHDETRTLRSDLSSIQVAGRRHPYRIVIDEIGGRFARVSEFLWQRLRRGDDDPELWAQAQSAGWTRSRTTTPTRRFSPLAIRIPLGSIDGVAKKLAIHSGVVFAPAAILIWLALTLFVALMVLSRSEQLAGSLAALPSFYRQANPLIIGGVLLITKVIHELAHAVMCRRMGGRSGDVGVLLLCGIPCPYCDVTDVWRQPSAIKRAGVMLAGIYVELIIATIAAIVWIGSNDTWIQLSALNVMIICSISTVVFNANPLMRYDGYHVLADLLGSVQLRQEASTAYSGVVTRRLAGVNYQREKRSDRRSLFLAGFHVASKLYRVLVACAIAALVIRYADWFGLRNVAVTMVVVAVTLMVARTFRRLGHVLTGEARWLRVAAKRRFALVTLLVIFVMLVVVMPLPRYRRATGVVDAASGRAVYVPEAGLVADVLANFGQTVQQDSLLMQLDRDAIAVQQIKLEGQLSVAKLRGDLSRRAALQRSRSAQLQTAGWTTLQAAEEAVATQLASVRKRIFDANVRAPISGTVIPPRPTFQSSDRSAVSLDKLSGTACRSGQIWCRVSSDGRLHAAIVLGAGDRSNVQVGSLVMISLAQSPGKVFASEVVSVSEIEQASADGLPVAAYQVLCPLPTVAEDQLLLWVGQECRAVFRLPNRTLAAGFTAWLGDWLRG